MDVVIGASGDLGSRVVDRLLDGGGAVRATSRDPDTRLAGARARGAETVRVDLRDPETIGPAVEGADRVVLVSQGLFPPDRRNHPGTADVEGGRHMIDAVRGAGVGHVVFASVAGAAPDAPAKWWRVKHETERRLEEGGIPHTRIRYAGLFIEAHCLLFLAEPVRDGRRVQMFAPPDNPVRWIAADDAADHLVGVLEDRGSGSAATSVTGTDLLSRAEVLGIVERALGREAQTIGVPLPVLRAMRTLTRSWHPGLHHLLDLGVAEHEHPDFIGWSADAEDVDHIGPTTVEEVVRRWAEATA